MNNWLLKLLYFYTFLLKRINLSNALEHEFFSKLPAHLRHEDDPSLSNLNKRSSASWVFKLIWLLFYSFLLKYFNV